MRRKVYLTPVGSLWLILDEGCWAADASDPDPAVGLNLETGEVRVFSRPLAGLMVYGWREL